MNELSNRIVELIESARKYVVRATNSFMVYTYFSIGKMIIEEIQNGKDKAEYGKRLLENLSVDLTNKLGKGYSVDNLENMRRFYHVYSGQFAISENPSRILSNRLISETDSRKFPSEILSWSHYVFLSRLENINERSFYEIECLQNNWGLKELKRQFNSGLYERLLLSTDKDKVMTLSKKGQIIESPNDIIKEPFILEFLGLEEQNSFSESELETAIINQIEKFMLELGKGFFFGGRQVRFTFDEEHYRVDLVFYNRLLKCFVLIDLKIGKLTHQDLGQMQMYINYYDRYIKNNSENSTIGIVLCRQKNQSIVEITLPEDNKQLFAAQYQTILPSKDDFIKLIEANY